MLETIQNTLLTLIQAVIVAAVPIITGAVISYCKAKQRQADAEANTTTARHALDELAEAAYAAAAKTSNAYVDELKKSDTFDKDAQAEALQQAKNTAIAAITPATLAFLQSSYSNLQSMIETKIEEAVRTQKNE